MLGLVALSTGACAQINLNLGLMRNGVISLNEPISLELNQKAKKAYEDNEVYIEAQLVKEENAEALISFTVATKGETNNFVIRGMPQMLMYLAKDLRMSTLLCDGRGEHFTLIIVASR